MGRSWMSRVADRLKHPLKSFSTDVSYEVDLDSCRSHQDPRPLCVICTDVLGLQKVSATRCGHVYHESCLQRWLLRANSCPQCRKPVCRSTLVPRLYFNVDSSGSVDEARQRQSCSDKVSVKELQQLQENLRTEQLLVQELHKKTEEEQSRHRLTRLFCSELKEAIRSSNRRESHFLRALHKEIQTLKNLATGLATSCEINPHTRVAEELWNQIEKISIFLEHMKHHDCHNIDYFLRRIWRLLAELQARSNEVRELRHQLEKVILDSNELERRMHEMREQMHCGLVSLHQQLREARERLYHQEQQTVDLTAENATLSLMLKWEREHAFNECWWPPSQLWYYFSNLCRRLPFHILNRIRFSVVLYHDDDDESTISIPIAREYEREAGWRTTFYMCVTVASFALASFLKLEPVLVLFVASIATGLIAHRDEQWD